MISRQEHNEQARKAGRVRLKSIMDRYYSSDSRIYGHFGGIRRKLSDRERNQIREERRFETRKSFRWTLIVFSLAALMVGYLCYLLLLSLSYL